MPTFPALTRFVGRACGRLDRLREGRAARALIERATSESGFSLIEVIASALIVGLIVVGTLTGFVSAGRASANTRQHNQALLLAAQDEESLRAMNVTELGRMGTLIRPIVIENGTKYTIESRAQFVAAAKEEFTCETSGGTADYIQTTSKVSWLSLGKTENKKRVTESLSQSSLIPVPTSTSLMVTVNDQDNEPVSGATVKVTGKTMGTVQQTTPESGCVIFGALPNSEVTITATKPGWVNEQGETEPAATEAKLSTTSLVSDTFVIGEPGKITAEFESAGSTAGVQGDTIYVSHANMSQPVIAGTANSFASSITAEELFPFATPGNPPSTNPYTVYAGDCVNENPVLIANPNPITGGVKEVTDRLAQVNPGATTTVKVEVPAVNVVVYEGSSSTSPGSLDSKAEAKITNISSGCSGSAARKMKTTSTGTLEYKYQPYAEKLKLCLQQTFSGTRYSHSVEFANTARAGINLGTIYMAATAYKGGAAC